MVAVIQLFGSGAHCCSLHLRFSSVLVDEERNLHTKVEYMRRIAVSHSGCCCLRKGDKPEDKHTIFIHELQSALRLAVVFSYIYCEM
jgi:hypothetical protein